MGLEAVLAEVQAAIAAEHPTVTFRFGARWLAANDPAPRIVWIPLGESFQGGPARGPNVGRQRATGARGVRVGVHVWAGTFAGAEALLENVLRCAHKVAVGSYAPGSTDWEPTGHQDKGEVATLELTLTVPVMDAPDPTVNVDAVELDPAPETPGDGVVSNGDP